MVTSMTETFRNGTVLITGCTGFLGKMLVEKLLRSCPVATVAIIVRSKKGLNADQRVADVYKQTLFDRLRREKPDFMNSIRIIDGNLKGPSMGLSSTDRDWMIENVNFVFHCAASIKFNEPLDLATKINVQGTENLLTLATEMKKLKGFVYVSTAYSHCPRSEIGEKFYPVPITPKELKNMCDLDALQTSKIIKGWPNTYCFTKAIAENLVLMNAYHLPISVFRPSIIGSTKSEPDAGWLENMNGPSGIVVGVMVGLLRTFPAVGNKITDMVPADYTVNALISVMWDTVFRHQNNPKREKDSEPKIYNYVSSVESPLTWDRYIKEMNDLYHEAPPLQSVWYKFYIFYTNLWVGEMLKFWLHRIPAASIDLLSSILRGKKSKMLKTYAKTERMVDMLYTFSTRQWEFDNGNVRELWSTLNEDDRQTFWFSLEGFKWSPYIKSYFYGIRKHILHEDPSNTTRALAKNRKLFWLHQLCVVLVVYLICQISWIFIRYLF